MGRVAVLDVTPERDPGKARCAGIMDLVVVMPGLAITAHVIARRPKTIGRGFWTDPFYFRVPYELNF